MLNSVFLQILKMSLTASYVILFVLLMRLLLKRAPKLCSYALWAVVLVRLLCPFSPEGRFSLIPIQGQDTVDSAITTAQTISSQPASFSATVFSQDPTVWHNAQFQAASELNSGSPSLSPLQVLITIGAVLWLAVAVFLLFRCIQQSWKLWQRLQGTGFRQGNVYRSTAVDTPFVMGILRPTIYLPTGLCDEEEEYICFHERTHLKRLDHITRLLAYLACCLHWFNPLVWLAYRVSEQDMELACDEHVLNVLGKQITKGYSSSILSFAAGRAPIRGMLAFASGDTDGRIRHALSYKKPAFWVVLTAILAAAAVGIGLLVNPAKTEQAPSNYADPVPSAQEEYDPNYNYSNSDEPFATVPLETYLEAGHLYGCLVDVDTENRTIIMEAADDISDTEIVQWGDTYLFSLSDDCTFYFGGDTDTGYTCVTTNIEQITWAIQYYNNEQTVYLPVFCFELNDEQQVCRMWERLPDPEPLAVGWDGYVTLSGTDLIVDKAELVFAFETEQIQELGLENNEFLLTNGYYIYNPDTTDTVTIPLAGDVSYGIIVEDAQDFSYTGLDMTYRDIWDYLRSCETPPYMRVLQDPYGQQWTSLQEYDLQNCNITETSP